MSFAGLKVTELKELLREKGLPVGGLKAELVKRLEEATAAENEAPQKPQQVSALPACLSGCSDHKC